MHGDLMCLFVITVKDQHAALLHPHGAFTGTSKSLPVPRRLQDFKFLEYMEFLKKVAGVALRVPYYSFSQLTLP